MPRRTWQIKWHDKIVKCWKRTQHLNSMMIYCVVIMMYENCRHLFCPENCIFFQTNQLLFSGSIYKHFLFMLWFLTTVFFFILSVIATMFRQLYVSDLLLFLKVLNWNLFFLPYILNKLHLCDWHRLLTISCANIFLL